ncbi:MAG: TonB-dependent receptor, partial [Candidatus Acidiferrales bacterium]
MKLRLAFAALIFSVCAAFLAPGSPAQTAQGRIAGQVTDSSGAAIVNAKVTIQNTASGVARVLETNSAGDYVAPGIEPGLYSITVEFAGFEKLVRERVQVEVGNDLKIDFRLKPGAITQSIDVNEELPLTETNDAVLNGVLSNKAINELPLQGRDFQNLLALHPGVEREPGGGFHTVTSNGMRPDDNNFIIDGANDNDVYYGETVVNDAGISGTPASTLPLDAIQEFNTQEQPGADYGSKPGVVVNIGIKSGTNQIHGSAYYFHRNSAFDARNYYNPDPQPISALLLHQFGASIGGPILKSKWFYFANYEGVRDKVGNPFNAEAPVTTSLLGRTDPDTAAIYSREDAEAAAGCNLDPVPVATCNPLSVKILGLLTPNPGFTADPDDPGAINFDFNNVNREDNLVFKTDYHPNDKNSFSVRFIYANSHEIEEDTTPLAPQWLSAASPITQVFGGDWTWTPNSRWVNDARVSYNRFSEFIDPVDGNVNPTAYGLNTGITDPRLFGFPRINPDDTNAGFDYMGGNSSWPLSTSPSATYNYSDTISFTSGRHSIHFGGSFMHGNVNYYRASFGRGRVNFDSLADFLAGNSEFWDLLYGDPSRNVSLNSWGLFAQDDFRITPRVTINAGLRYDVTYPIKDKHNMLANFVPTEGIVQVGDGISQPYPTNYNNVSPRIGVAWDVFGTGKTVVRGGFGMIFVQPSIRTFMFSGGGLNLNPSGIAGVTPGTGTITSFEVESEDPSFITWNTDGPIFPVSNTSQNSCSFDFPCTIFGVDQHLKTPYVMNWNLNIQQQVARDTVLQVAYVGNRGHNLYSTTDPNQVNPALDDGGEQLGRPFVTNCPNNPCFPFIGFMNFLSNLSTSSYNALQATLTKRYSHGLYGLVGYTYGHAIDTAGETTNLADVPQNSLNFDAEKASGDYDIRHRLTVAVTYELPGVKAPLQLLKGWQITGIAMFQTGEPINFFDSSDDLTLTGEGFNNAGNDRWNIQGDPHKIKWGRDSAHKIPFLDASDPICQSVATTPALQDALNYVEGCYAENGTILYPNAFGTFGNMGRNIFRGPGFSDVDASLGKSWTLTERLKLQLRAEFFNVLNHPNFAGSSVRANMGGSNLGITRGTPDVWASNPVIGSGGSRHIQLGAK